MMETGDNRKESAEVTEAFKALEAQERASENQKHKLSVKQVVGIILAMSLAPLLALWAFNYMG